jgi:hypothetical protein
LAGNCCLSKEKQHDRHKLIDSLLANDKKPEDLIGENGPLKQLIKKLIEHVRYGVNLQSLYRTVPKVNFSTETKEKGLNEITLSP